MTCLTSAVKMVYDVLERLLELTGKVLGRMYNGKEKRQGAMERVA